MQCFSQYSDSDVRKVYSEKLRGLSAAEIIAAFTKEEVQRKERRRKKEEKREEEKRGLSAAEIIAAFTEEDEVPRKTLLGRCITVQCVLILKYSFYHDIYSSIR